MSYGRIVIDPLMKTLCISALAAFVVAAVRLDVADALVGGGFVLVAILAFQGQNLERFERWLYLGKPPERSATYFERARWQRPFLGVVCVLFFVVLRLVPFVVAWARPG